MTDIDKLQKHKTEPAGMINTAINIITSPAEAFAEIQERPTKIFPMTVVLFSMMLVMLWYYNIVDFDWFIDDAMRLSNISEVQMEQAREQMGSMSQATFTAVGILGSTVFLVVLWILQAGYLSLASALNGDQFRFTNWFSLVVWTALPYLLSTVGMAVTIMLSPNGQLSAFDLNPLTLRNLGIATSIDSLNRVFSQLDLTIIWGITLTVMAYKQWLQSSWPKACGIVLAPYLLFIGVWTYFALT
ncbi:MAG: YIP1 family protein [Gammaproteobacteria bacterium]|nr:YIP1 family protein [Gammaproteobacteria bacterium]MDD9959943.1 YIP1 family protein [Gammaproteobacteria bacterium]